MVFVKDIRRQLCQIMQKISNDRLEVGARGRKSSSRDDYRKLRKALCVGNANQVAERMLRHNGYMTLTFTPQLVRVHPSSVLSTDNEGMLPNYVVYHELISTTRPYMRNVCTVEMSWVAPIKRKMEKLNIRKLSGGPAIYVKESEKEKPELSRNNAETPAVSENVESRIQSAREQFLAWKGHK